MPNYPDLALEPIVEEEDKEADVPSQPSGSFTLNLSAMKGFKNSQKLEPDAEEEKSQGSFSARFRERMKTNIASV